MSALAAAGVAPVEYAVAVDRYLAEAQAQPGLPPRVPDLAGRLGLAAGRPGAAGRREPPRGDPAHRAVGRAQPR